MQYLTATQLAARDLEPGMVTAQGLIEAVRVNEWDASGRHLPRGRRVVQVRFLAYGVAMEVLEDAPIGVLGRLDTLTAAVERAEYQGA